MLLVVQRLLASCLGFKAVSSARIHRSKPTQFPPGPRQCGRISTSFSTPHGLINQHRRRKRRAIGGHATLDLYGGSQGIAESIPVSSKLAFVAP